MTNLSIVVTLWVNLVTNPAPAGYLTNGASFYEITRVSTINQYLADGSYLNCQTIAHADYVTNNPAKASAAPPPKWAEPMRAQFKQLPLPPRRHPRAQYNLFQFAPQIANGGTDNIENICPMFKTAFPTNLGFIYGLESSQNMVSWTLCPPELDGTGSPESFFDVLNGARFYRVVSRPGVLPE